MEKRRRSFPFVFRRSRTPLDSTTDSRQNNNNNNTNRKVDQLKDQPSPKLKSKSKTLSPILKNRNKSSSEDNANSSATDSINNNKKEKSVGNVLLNVLPVISLTSADNKTTEDPEEMERISHKEQASLLPT
uniref:Uncharacterized protein n=2 Tax=Clytia hemisphaerica TaxID=252671 RepID=A0A7M5XKN9_9CNID